MPRAPAKKPTKKQAAARRRLLARFGASANVTKAQARRIRAEWRS
jgi:hypothetical protein